MAKGPKRTIVGNLGDWSADEDAKPRPIWTVDAPCRVVSFGLCSEAAVTDQDTNYNTFALMNNDAETVASLANGPAATGVIIKDIADGYGAATVDADYEQLETDEWLYLLSTKTGNGLAVASMGFELVVEYNK